MNRGVWLLGLRLVMAVIAMSALGHAAWAQSASDTLDPVAADGVAIGGDLSSLSGQVLIGAVCPVVRIDQPDQCADRPYQATLSIRTSADDQEVTQVTTDDQGIFAIDLAAGAYLVVPLTPPGRILPRGVPQTVALESGTTTTITVHYDSGIR